MFYEPSPWNVQALVQTVRGLLRTTRAIVVYALSFIAKLSITLNNTIFSDAHYNYLAYFFLLNNLPGSYVSEAIQYEKGYAHSPHDNASFEKCLVIALRHIARTTDS